MHAMLRKRKCGNAAGAHSSGPGAPFPPLRSPLFFFPAASRDQNECPLDAGGFGKDESDLGKTSRPGDEEGDMHAGAWEVATGAREVAGVGA